MNAAYLIAVLVVAFYSVMVGFRRGITRQIASLLGFGFGAVCSRVLTPEFAGSFLWTSKLSQAEEFAVFTAWLFCGITIYAVVYFLFSLLSPLLKSAMSVIAVGMFNRILGAFFTLTKNLLWLSIVLNIFLCLSPESELIRYEKANDGNLVGAVMNMTHAILGCPGAEEFAHFHQLKEAKKIS